MFINFFLIIYLRLFVVYLTTL